MTAERLGWVGSGNSAHGRDLAAVGQPARPWLVPYSTSAPGSAVGCPCRKSARWPRREGSLHSGRTWRRRSHSRREGEGRMPFDGAGKTPQSMIVLEMIEFFFEGGARWARRTYCTADG